MPINTFISILEEEGYIDIVPVDNHRVQFSTKEGLIFIVDLKNFEIKLNNPDSLTNLNNIDFWEKFIQYRRKIIDILTR